MAIHDIGPTGTGMRGLDKIPAANPGAQDASKAPGAEGGKGDSIEVSLAARALASAEDAEAVAARERHAAEMRKVIEAGELASPERLERAARRLLGG